MRDLKKILKLRASNKSQRFIADSLKISRNTVSRIFSLADQKQLYWEKAHNMDENQIESYLFGNDTVNLIYQSPDFEKIHKELLKPGVTLQLLWMNTWNSADPLGNHSIREVISTSCTQIT